MDLAILKFFNLSLASPFGDFLLGNIGNFDYWRWLLGIVIILFLWKGGSQGRWFVLACVITIAIVDPSVHYILKPLFGRLRPCREAELAWLRLIDGCGGKYGFPSSHAANAMAMATVSFLFYKKTAYYLYPLAILIALSRIYLGVHYPSDALVGMIYGALVATAVALATKNLASRRKADYLQART